MDIRIKNKRLAYFLGITFAIVIMISQLLVFTSCDAANPTGVSNSDTCDIAYVVLEPSSITVNVGDDRVVFTAEAYDSEDNILDPAPSFEFSVDTDEVHLNAPSGNRVYVSPWTVTTTPAHITATATDCSGREYTDTSTMIVNESPTWLFLRLFT
ncbi:MAG: hypothetical protein ACLFSQ_11465 [Candidatus Zixiibacteriota bacterium]